MVYIYIYTALYNDLVLSLKVLNRLKLDSPTLRETRPLFSTTSIA